MIKQIYQTLCHDIERRDITQAVNVSYLLWFAVAGQLHCDSRQVGSVGEGQEGRTGSSSKHILLVFRSLIAPHLRTQEEEEEEEGRGAWTRHWATETNEIFLRVRGTCSKKNPSSVVNANKMSPRPVLLSDKAQSQCS